MTMGFRIRISILLLAALLAAPLPGPASAAGARGADEGRDALLARMRARLPRSRIDRPRDLVVLRGKEVALPGEPVAISRLRVVVYRPDEEWIVIPFQIDERDAGGRWIWPAAAGSPDSHAAEGEGMFTPEDELVFRPRDLGIRVARTAWPKGTIAGVELEVQDPVTGHRGWAYLFQFDEPVPPLPAVDDVRAYAASAALGDSFVTPYYRIFYPRRGGHFVPSVMTELAIDGKGRERHGPNLLDREKLRYEGRLRFLPGADFRRNEDRNDARPLGVIDGPLRAIRKIERRVRLRPWLDARMESTTIHLPDRVILEEPDGVPGAMSNLVRDVTARLYWDFQPPDGSTVFAAPIPKGVPADGKETPVEEALDGLPSAWWALRTPQHGALLAVFQKGAKGGTRSPAPTLLFSDDATPDPPERAPGRRPAIGWQLTNAGRRAGDGPDQVHLYVLEDFGPGTEKIVLARLGAPLRVKAGPGLAR